ncbi:hypothetical protein GUJ93_ZPchr0007g6336 [Zizania palustris]|uniref:NECAP PHear domain-containing protein n=1 Tax=Zizania palustris TaxID=103762 RepID=A0A8J5W532_ZIZPA|nr:hypothetical protein GUJ93_ZPchr0007g6336 [Zizania palustris]
MTVASYRADEWNVNKRAWEGTLKVISKGEECIIRLEDNNTGELYAREFLREGEPHPVEPVIDSSRYFVLRVEENIDGRQRHAFVGLGFRERPQAYDFQATLHDHMKYLNKKRMAEEMVLHYEKTTSVDYSLKEGETLVLQLKNLESDAKIKSAFFFEQGLNKLSFNDKANSKEAPERPAAAEKATQETVDDDFGDSGSWMSHLHVGFFCSEPQNYSNWRELGKQSDSNSRTHSVLEAIKQPRPSLSGRWSSCRCCSRPSAPTSVGGDPRTEEERRQRAYSLANLGKKTKKDPSLFV